jgi:serine/threonine protein kinase/WD40 repeat protein/tetratricopeptide (TPR) repeat protein
MNAHQEKLKAILAEAVARENPAERRAYLDSACSGDDALRARVEALLEAYGKAGDLLNRSVVTPPAELPGESAGSQVGHYKLLEQIGEGGFGRVFMAEQSAPVKRKVALKIIKAGMDTREVVARFEAERQALALMDHPNIARVFDGGSTDTGRPYFVMELVNGIPITEYCDRNNLTTEARLRVFARVCNAIQHAHQKGVIHRDLKPSNILVTVVDGEALPKIIDFGVAKALNQKLTERTFFTAFQQMIGTPAYMSPEQAELSGVDVDTRSDIYSLGVLLYELLTGVTPFDKETLAKAGLDEIRRMIREAEPAKPSTRLRTLGNKLTEVAKCRHTEPTVLPRLVDGELDWIVMKALEKDRAQRYQTANGLLQDVENHLRHEPVSAAAPGALYRVRKYVRRHRVGVAVSATFLLLLVAGLLFTTLGYMEARRQRDHARAAEAAMQKQQSLAEQHAQTALEERDKAMLLAARAAAERGQARLEAGDSQGLFNLVNAMKLAEHNPKYQSKVASWWSIWYGYWDQATLGFARPNGRLSPDFTSFASVHWYPPDNRSNQVFVSRMFESGSIGPMVHESVPRSCAYTRDGKVLATVTDKGFIHLWDLSTGRPARDPVSTGIPNLKSVLISPDDRYLLARSSSPKTAFLRLQELASSVRILTNGYGVDNAAFTPDSELLAILSLPTLELWRTADLQQVGLLRGGEDNGNAVLDISNNGELLAFPHAGLSLLDLRTREELGTLPTHGLREVKFSHNGGVIAVAKWDGTLEVWDTKTRSQKYPARRPRGSLSSLCFSPDDSCLAVVESTGQTFVYQTETGEEKFHPRQIDYPSVHFLTNDVIVGTALECFAVFWDLAASPLPYEYLPHDLMTHAAAFNQSGDVLATGSDSELRLWSMQSAPVQTQSVPLPGPCRSLVFSEEDRKFLVFAEDGSITEVDPATGTAKTHQNIGAGFGFNAALAPDGSRVALWKTTDAFVIDIATGIFHRHGGNRDAAFSRDSKWLLTGSTHWEARSYNLTADTNLIGQKVGPIQNWVEAVAIHPSNRRVAVFMREIGLQIFDPARHLPPHGPKPGRLRTVTKLQFSSSGHLLAAVGTDASGKPAVELWSMDDEHGLFDRGLLLPHAYGIECLAFSPDDSVLVVGGPGVTRLWQLPPPPATPQQAEERTLQTLGFRESGPRVLATPELTPARSARVFHRPKRQIPEYEAALSLPDTELGAALERLMLAYPQMPAYQAALDDYYVRLMNSLAQKGVAAESLLALDHVSETAERSQNLWNIRGLLQLASGDFAGYEETCQHTMARLKNDLDVEKLNLMSWLVCVRPTAITNYTPLLEHMRRALERRGETNSFQLAALCCRAGYYREALTRLDGLIAPEGFINYVLLNRELIRVISLIKAGDLEKADAHYQKSCAPFRTTRRGVDSVLLDSEARELLQQGNSPELR